MPINISSANTGGISHVDLAEIELLAHENKSNNFNPYNDTSLAMGYGYDLIQNSISEINEALSYVDKSKLTQSQIALIEDAKLKQNLVDSAVRESRGQIT